MKNLKEFINEGLFSRIKKTNVLNKINRSIPDKMPKKYVDLIEKYFREDVNRDDVKTRTDVEEYLKYAADEIWDAIDDEFWDQEEVDFYDYREVIYNKWIDQIVKIALK